MSNPRVENILENVMIWDVLTELGVLDSDEIVERNLPCPFHGFGQERRPSARCYQESDACPGGLFHCFTCDKSWNAIQFVADFQEVEFFTAMLWLERNFNITPPTPVQAVEKAFEKPKILSRESLPQRLDVADMILRRHRSKFDLAKFRTYSDISDLLRYQAEQGDSEAPTRVQKFVSGLMKMVGYPTP